MLHIGFSTEFYTLWDVQSNPVYETVQTARGPVSYVAYYNTSYYYIQNLSKDLGQAQEKARQMGCTDLEPDTDLYGRGNRSFETRGKELIPVLHWSLFETPVYNVQGKDIASFDYSETYVKRGNWRGEDYADVKLPGISALWVEYLRVKENKDGEVITFNMLRRAALCRQMLVKLGKLAKDQFTGEYSTPKSIAAGEQKRLLGSLATGHHFENGKRVDLKIKEVKSFNFGTQFGTTWVVLYATECGKLVKYMGANPPEVSKEGFTQVKATIKHDYYNSDPETKLQRIK
jgi:hypothetical protein